MAFFRHLRPRVATRLPLANANREAKCQTFGGLPCHDKRNEVDSHAGILLAYSWLNGIFKISFEMRIKEKELQRAILMEKGGGVKTPLPGGRPIRIDIEH